MKDLWMQYVDTHYSNKGYLNWIEITLSRYGRKGCTEGQAYVGAPLVTMTVYEKGVSKGINSRSGTTQSLHVCPKATFKRWHR